ncbi:MAG: phage gp6-like head-tail connector protein [Rhizobiales bacterium]|nr:phage gp6-like head-tail connector protein [Hyphomicrobiales bacterium]
MASLISLEEAQLAFEQRASLGGYALVKEWLRVDPGDFDAEVSRLFNVAWQRVEARIGHRYAPRAFTAIVRADRSNELISLPITPTTIATVEKFDPDTGLYAVQSALKAGPEPSSYVLPDSAAWRLTGTAGPTPAQLAPFSIVQAVFLIVAYMFENRGDVGHDFKGEGYFVGSGAADLLRHYVRH